MKEDGMMTDWRKRIDKVLDLIHSEQTLHLIYNLLVSIWSQEED